MMTYSKLYIISLLFVAFFDQAQVIAKDKPISSLLIADSIPVELLEKAEAVVRSEKIQVEVLSTFEKRVTKQYVLTVLSAKGNRFADIKIHYEKDANITNFDGNVYDKYGHHIKNIHEGDLKDYYAGQGSFDSDSRLMYYDYTPSTYPYTIELTYIQEYDEFLSFDNWHPLWGYDIATENSEYKFISDINYPLRIKSINWDEAPNHTSIIASNKKIETWSISHQKAWEKEDYTPSFKELVATVLIEPVTFKYDGVWGGFDSWETFGKWLWNISNTKEQLLPEAVKRVLEEINHQKISDQEKTKLVYEYMQSQTRYISIQIGIGGFVPFPSEYVATKGYGDCKALSNYTKVMLDYIGIPSYLAVIGAGAKTPSIYLDDFASFGQSNHMITCVPLKEDTIWLECTSQIESFGFLSDFTSDRNALLITKEGGKVVKTTIYEAKENSMLNRATIVLDPNGNAQIEIDQQLRGIQVGEELSNIHLEGKGKQKEFLLKKIDFPGITLNEFDIQHQKGRIPSAALSASLVSNKYASKSSSGLFIPLNRFNRIDLGLEPIEERTKPIAWYYAFEDMDTTIIEVPEGYLPKKIPAPFKLVTDFGSYEYQVSFDEISRSIFYIRKLSCPKGRYSVDKYPAFKAFWDAVKKGDKKRLYFKKSA